MNAMQFVSPLSTCPERRVPHTPPAYVADLAKATRLGGDLTAFGAARPDVDPQVMSLLIGARWAH